MIAERDLRTATERAVDARPGTGTPCGACGTTLPCIVVHDAGRIVSLCSRHCAAVWLATTLPPSPGEASP